MRYSRRLFLDVSHPRLPLEIIELDTLARCAEDGDEDDYVPDKSDGQLPNPLGFVWRS